MAFISLPLTGAELWAQYAATLESAPRPPKRACAFCEEETDRYDTHDKHGWVLCQLYTACRSAAAAQTERMYAGLVDCPETRRSALAWVKAQ
jgi:hypothetical protein